MAELLIIDDDRSIRRTLELQLTSLKHNVKTAGNGEEGLRIWRESPPDLIILDLMLPDYNGLEILNISNNEKLTGSVILVTGHEDLDKAALAMQAGAFDYIHKPLDLDELDAVISRALYLQTISEEGVLTVDLSHIADEDRIIGKSRSMIELHKMIGLASRGRANVLIRGESGVGKELVAHAVHRHTNPKAPFVPINCSAFVPTLLESELFGHERGAFTGAVQAKKGRLELAGDGTLFLDEIGDLETGLQAKLLRVLQERQYEPVGGTKSRKFSARLICATHRNLEEMISNGAFREDLYFRIKVIEIKIPPLRERLDDIPFLVKHLVSKINLELRRNVSKVPVKFIERLKQYDWHGNIRELENLLTVGVMHSSGDTLGDIDLETISPLMSQNNAIKPAEDKAWRKSLTVVEREHIINVLDKVGGRLGSACEVLGISRPTLRKRIAEFEIDLQLYHD